MARPRITCPGVTPSCTVTATVRRAGSSSSIASIKLTIAPGATKTLHFTLTSTTRVLLRRRVELRATVAIVAKHATATSTRTVKLTLVRPR